MPYIFKMEEVDMRAGVASSLATTTSTYRYILYIQKIKFIIILDQHKYRYRVY